MHYASGLFKSRVSTREMEGLSDIVVGRGELAGKMAVVSRNASTGDAPAAGPELVEVASAME